MKRVLQIFLRFWFLLAISLYSLIFILPIPPQVNFKGVQIVDEAIVLAGCGLIFLAFKKTGWGWKTLALTITLTIFTLPLLRLWESAESNYNLVLGLLPWSDANGYYSDATTLLQGDLFGEFSGHRPLFTGFLAVLLKISHGNIQASVLALTILTGLAAFLLAWEIQLHFGSFTSAGLLLLLQYYYRQFAGTLVTEQLGLPLGLIALGCLLSATRPKNKWVFAGGLSLLTLALFARAGAFFVLPAVLITGIFIFKENQLFSPKNVLIFIAAMLIGWGLNAGLEKTVVTPGVSSLGNFSYTLYGQAMGGKGWTQIFKDHPEVSRMNDQQRAQTIYQLVWDEVSQNPLGLVRGFFNAWIDFFLPSMFAGFGFIQPGGKYTSLILQPILTTFLFIGLFQSWKRKEQDQHLLLLALAAGIFLSIPLIPPKDATWMRVYAATISIPALLACSSLAGIFRKQSMPAPDQGLATQRRMAFAALGLGLVIAATAGTLVVKQIAQKEQRADADCPTGSLPVQFQLSQGAYILIATNESNQKTYVPTVAARDFRKSMRGFPGVYHYFSDALIEAITPPVLLTYNRNMLTGTFHWLIVPPEFASSAGKTTLACGDAAGQDFSVLYIKATQ